MLDTVKTKTFVKLTEDHSQEGCFLYPEEKCFLPEGTEGLIIDEHTISMFSYLPQEEYSKIIRREIAAKGAASYLVLIEGRLVTISVRDLKILRYEPPGTIFEDQEDRDQYFNEFFSEIKRQHSEDNQNASA